MTKLCHYRALKIGPIRLILDGAICLADSFEVMIYHCMRLVGMSKFE